MFCVCFVVIVCFFKPLNSNMFHCRNQRFDIHKQIMRNEIDYSMTMILALFSLLVWARSKRLLLLGLGQAL